MNKYFFTLLSVLLCIGKGVVEAFALVNTIPLDRSKGTTPIQRYHSEKKHINHHEISGVIYSEKIISIKGVQPFKVLETTNNCSFERLTKYLVKYQETLIQDKNIVVIGAQHMVISLLAVRLGATNVKVWDIDDEDSGGSIKTLNYADKVLNNDYPKTKRRYCDLETISISDIADDETCDADVFILATTCTELINDPFVNEILRQTSASILMDTDMIDVFCYHTRIQEGAEIMLW